MPLITVGGSGLPAPSEFSVGIQDISKAERNANGTMIIERITTKRKIDLGWAFLTAAQMAQILTAVAPVFFTVTYPDPQTNANRTGTFYCGDRPTPMMDFKAGVPRYKDVKFSMIEK